MASLAEIPKNTEIAPVTPMQLIERAPADLPVERMAQLFELQLRWEENQARKAFKKAFAGFKSECVTITKNVTVKDGPLKDKKYADLWGVVSAIIPALSNHGLSHSWKLTKDEPAWMEVTCTISHEDGYSESVSMGAAPDTGPGRNAIQARGSAKSYLERYTLLAATGMAAAGTDNDGAGAPKAQGMPERELLEALDAIANAAHLTELHSIYAAHYKAARALRDDEALAQMEAAKNKRKEELK